MNKHTMADGDLTIGLDLGDRFTEGRVLDKLGEVVEAMSHWLLNFGERAAAPIATSYATFC